MNIITRELRETPLLWLLVAVPAVFTVEHLAPGRHTMLFVLAVLAIVPLAALLSKATESVAAKTGDAVGGLLNATLGNLTELVIALTALRAGMFDLVKASIAGAIMTNSLFMLGMALLLGGLKYRTQEFNRATARFQSGLLLLAAIALLVPSMIGSSDRPGADDFALQLSIGLSVLLLVAYVLGLLFSLGTHKAEFAGSAHGGADEEEHLWPVAVAGTVQGIALAVTYNRGLIVLTGTWMILVLAYFIRKVPFSIKTTSALLQQIKQVLARPPTGAGVGVGDLAFEEGAPRPGQGRGRGAGGGTCICPQCGQRSPHERGVPCNEQRCSNCGAAMHRE